MCVLGLSSREVKLFLAVCMSVPLKVISNCSEGNRVEDIAFSSSWVAQCQVYVEDGPLGHCCRLHTPLSLSVSSLSLFPLTLSLLPLSQLVTFNTILVLFKSTVLMEVGKCCLIFCWIKPVYCNSHTCFRVLNSHQEFPTPHSK